MIALGTLSAFEDVQALLKGKVGEFLAAEQKLRTLAQSPSISIRSEAAGLLAVHMQLEKEMSEAQTKIANFQTGAWSISDAITLGDVGTRLLSHLRKVTSLEGRAGGVVQAGLMPTSMTPYLGIAAVATVLIFLLRK